MTTPATAPSSTFPTFEDPVTGDQVYDCLWLVKQLGLLEQAVLDHGYVKVLDVMPRLFPVDLESGDFALADAARGSYQKGTRKVRSDAGLVDYLVRKLHTSPIEMAELKFAMRMPIFVARQFVRHRTASLNEESARYSILDSDFYVPAVDQWRVNSAANRQATVAGDFTAEAAAKLSEVLASHSNLAYSLYEAYLREPMTDDASPMEKFSQWQDIADMAGVSREQARMVLPLNIYTRWVWKCDLKNTLHLLKLRCDSHAQYEIRVYADAIASVVATLFPAAWASWKDNFMDGVNLSGTEVELLQMALFETQSIDDAGKRMHDLGWSLRRVDEFIDKLAFAPPTLREDLRTSWAKAKAEAGA